MGIQQMFLGAAPAADKTYIDDIFSTQVWSGNSSTNRAIVNGLDLSTDGGIVWIKERTGGQSHTIFDTKRGPEKALEPAGNAAEETQTGGVKAFNTNGFSVGNGGKQNDSGKDYMNWSWKSTPGFFDVVQYTGNNSARSIAHNLGCKPGFIIIKNATIGSHDYMCYHRDFAADGNALTLNSDSAMANYAGNVYHDVSAINSTHFGVGALDPTNNEDGTFVAYLFAGGEESSAATAKSVYMDGTGDYLYTASSNDFNMGTGDFTIEGWFKKTNDEANDGLFQITDDSDGLSDHNSGSIALAHKDVDDDWNGFHSYAAGSNFNAEIPFSFDGQWAHIAMVRTGGKTTVYANGMYQMSWDDNTNYSGTYLAIGGYAHTGLLFGGNISNFRVVKGTAVYTSEFRPPTSPLTNISGTSILCCNDTSITGKTVGPALTAVGDTAASTDSPFEDKTGLAIFGEGEDQEVIKCGSFTGNGSADYGPEIYIGWEPQWIMLKNVDKASTHWVLVDHVRGMNANGDNDIYATPDHSAGGEHAANLLEVNPMGFRITTTDDKVNENDDRILYVAIRRSDVLCGKPVELGTEQFATDRGVDPGGDGNPNFDSNFLVDFAMNRRFNQSSPNGKMVISSRQTMFKQGWWSSSSANDPFASINAAWPSLDNMTGYWDGTAAARDQNYQAWMWKRGKSFECMTYLGNGVAGLKVQHNLNAVPEMMWIKQMVGGYGKVWVCYHKGMNGGSSPEDYFMALDQNWAEADDIEYFNDTVPTSTDFTVGDHTRVNQLRKPYLAMLFTSIAGLSKVGYYTGDGTTDNSHAITLGFQPRYVMIRKTNGTSNWCFMDYVGGENGWVEYLASNLDDNQNTANFFNVTSTGWTFKSSSDLANGNNQKYIYYAQA